MARFISRIRFDLLLATILVAYLGLFFRLYLAAGGTVETAILRGFGSLAFLMLSFVLAIGPLSRFSPLFKRLIYNRRHLGVSTFFVGLVHAVLALLQFYEGDLLGLFTTNTEYWSLARFPFAPCGALVLVILAAMAATSHDWWFHRLGVVRWKGLHMLVYLAYAALVAHVAFGFLQDQGRPLLWVGFALVVGFVFGVHLLAAALELQVDTAPRQAEADGYVYACLLSELREGLGRAVSLGGERIAVVRHQGRAHALSNVCPHQNGPLGEGSICNGYLECPWHGYQFSPETGKGPPGYEDAVPVLPVRVEGDRVLVKPEPFLWDSRGAGAEARP